MPIYPEDDAETLAERVHEQEHAIYPLVVKWFSLGRLTMTDGKAYLDGLLIGESGYAPD